MRRVNGGNHIREILISSEWTGGKNFTINLQCIIRAAFTFALLDSARHPRDE
jgi:hypothetical protein